MSYTSPSPISGRQHHDVTEKAAENAFLRSIILFALVTVSQKLAEQKIIG